MSARVEPERLWWSVDDLIAATLPDMPTSKRGINVRAKDWRSQPGCARRKTGRGGGWEYHWSVLPMAAQRQLLELAPKEVAPTRSADEAWVEYDSLPQKTKDVAAFRLACIGEVEKLYAVGWTHVAAVGEAGLEYGVSGRTIYNWLALIEGVQVHDRLAYLAPRHRLAKRPKKTKVDRDFFNLVKDDFLRLEQPSFTSCYDRAVRIAQAEGLDISPIHQLRRLYRSEVSKPVEVFRRKGHEALRRFFPHQDRKKSALAPMECVQGDFHKFDLFVNWPGEKDPVRPQAVVFSDVHSGKLLVYRLSITANSHTVQLSIGDLVERYGIPKSALLDNGREFAAKVITGGTETRFRGKIKDDDIPGLLPLLGVQVHWATPYSGQSKPIERAFRDLCDRVAKHPAFAGAYTGNKPDAKPENYRSRAVDFDVFEEVLAQEIEAHNARPGRRSEVAFGRSFNEVFEEGYKATPIRRATDEQRRLWLLGAEGIRAKPNNGEIKLYNSRYWSDWMYRIAGQKVVARFDPEALHEGLHIYDLDGGYLNFAACVEKGDFLNVEDARNVARKRNQYTRAIKDEARAEQEYTAAQIAARLKSATGTPEVERPVAEIVQMVPAHPKAPRSNRSEPSIEQREGEARIAAEVTRLAERQKTSRPNDEEPEVLFARAQALEATLKEGGEITAAQSDWLADYQTSGQYAGFARMNRLFSQNND